MRLRPVRTLPAVTAIVLFAPVAGAQYATPPPYSPPQPRDHAPPPEDPAPLHRQSDLIGSRLDSWRDGVSILGVRYLHMYEHGGKADGVFSLPAAAIGLGADMGAINVSASEDRDKGFVAGAVLRAAVGAPMGWFSGELTSGVASGPGGAVQFASAGAFYGLYFLDFGYSYAFPLSPAGRPDWLSAGMFSVRAQIPLDSFGSTPERTRAQAESARAR